MSDAAAAVERTIATLTERLLARRTPSGHWEGQLASSALATATATVALTLAGRPIADRNRLRSASHGGQDQPSRFALRRSAVALAEAEGPRRTDNSALADGGIDWLIANQNADGGWGDTTISLSNLSTTVLCWSAISLCGEAHTGTPAAIAGAERWLRAHGAGIEPGSLRRAVLDRYGTDRTFSVPILTVLALAGKLGDGPGAWRLVPQLPFELAACPHRWFRWLRLPVVSYALPALVAMGQVRHHQAPTRNPALALLRSTVRARTLRIARNMQPESGGYLEAIPLTAFVVMSLAKAGAADHPIVAQGVRFLRAAARADGSWPIETNLATWVTTLSVDSLNGSGRLTPDDRHAVLAWLLGQQVAAEHPFTHAKPGGWGWTDLSGGVPDADDTAGALLAMWTLAGPSHLDAAIAGLEWLLDLQNSDGGIPTFCRGWGALPFDRSATDLTAHAIEAWSMWHDVVPPGLQRRITGAQNRAIAYLERQQRGDGSWAPLWFGNQHAAGEVNLTYGTARVVAVLSRTVPPSLAIGERWRGSAEALAEADTVSAAASCRRKGIAWLLRAQNADGGWGGDAATPSSIEETGLALHALSVDPEVDIAIRDARARAVRWLVVATEEGRSTPPSPIGFYFARLWYYEELYPIVFALKGLAHAGRAAA
jgi:squalene-hopene/tetraprenyl-beta-curcumene cyclase